MQQHWLWRWRKSEWVLCHQVWWHHFPLSPPYFWHWTPLAHGLRHNCISWMIPTAPSRRSKPEHAKSVWFKDCNGIASGTHNVIVCKDLLKISPPLFRAASLHEKGTSRWKIHLEKNQVWAQVISAERNGIDASTSSTTYIHFKLKEEIFLESQNPEWRDLNYDLCTLSSAHKLLGHKAKGFRLWAFKKENCL